MTGVLQQLIDRDVQRQSPNMFRAFVRSLVSLEEVTNSPGNDLFLHPALAQKNSVQGISILNLNRPQAKNALSIEMIELLRSCTEKLQSDHTVRCVLLASSVPGIFCAGADLKERINMTTDEAGNTVKHLRSAFDAFSRLPMPTIAVVNGPALGGGAELAIACDLRIGATTVKSAPGNAFLSGGPQARFAFPETRLAIIPGAGGTQRLPRLIGAAKAKEIIFTGKHLDAEESLSVGLLNRVVPNAMDEAMGVASEICKGGPIGLQMAKKAVDKGLDKSMPQALEVESSCYEETLKTEDRLEGLRAFKEKRTPHYKGH